MSDAKAMGWAAWHPQYGFKVPRWYSGAIAYDDLDGVVPLVRELNHIDRTTNRTGWRAVRIEIVKVPA